MLYARVSTADQTLSHQRAHAEAAGFHLDEVVADYAAVPTEGTAIYRSMRPPFI